MIGKIIKSQKELYYVDTEESLLMAKARGNFRVKDKKPLVGDNVEVDVLEDEKAYITKLLPRRNEIKRPNIANVDQLLVFITIDHPPLNLYNLDKYLAMCEYLNIDVVIILTKIDLVSQEKIKKIADIYMNLSYKLIEIDNYKDFPKDEILEVLKGKTSAVSGASGVGKSTFLSNVLDREIEIGEISQKSRRGKNTTRHTEIFKISKDTFIFDTPGFDSFEFDFLEDENDLKNTFVELRNRDCKFKDCNHINEPSCRVKEDLEVGKIAQSRYKNYLQLFEELKQRRLNKW
ncbi:ribosome small subunit-dependent GTPase A [Anaerococcus sp. NML200574]|uniref:ribosome small subunit-dependent GTPase A n=1 Tax=unclassified Anaerococcus TaxID=2614126 RepID=UPI00223837C1|nr:MULTISPECIES: ribosome small subunit-dependent GTPase A [unclassified Anaerococcus]MCW6678117.1 ribosome small subunit-dependent GTPase A [Anaerococcus sp. NML200574]MCW6701293.1 ribosome small subunit-dependent GTPase A [Anaerococcus sp. NML200537]